MKSIMEKKIKLVSRSGDAHFHGFRDIFGPQKVHGGNSTTLDVLYFLRLSWQFQTLAFSQAVLLTEGCLYPKVGHGIALEIGGIGKGALCMSSL